PEAITAEGKPEETSEESGPRRRGRRGGRGRSRSTKTAPADVDERSIIPTQAEPIDTPFVAGGVSFERVSDEEERAINGEMFKDARLQERIMDAVHAVEFDLEDVPSAPVGSLLSEGLNEGGDFQRVADDEEVAQPAARRAQQIEAAHVDHFVDDVAQESSRDFSFQRVSDDEQGLAQAEPVRESPLPGAAKRETAAERRRKKTGVIGRLFKSKKSEDDENAGDSELSSESTSEAVPDSQASITTGRPHEEFATRRGGRRRRRPSKTPLGAPETNESNGVDEYTEEEHSKEPIAKKGARITSHIALPGRFLVYMPTVEHLGVSRKIDSDAERARLRKLIQKIHADEKSPSGGFIVRTAGTGASEADLRADAQYLIRTWQDMRKSAEKA